MKIELMDDCHLEDIVKIDEMIFEREQPHTLLNLKGLRQGDPEGCFVLMDGNNMVGYSFTKTMGEEGYLGPVGIQPAFHGQGWGQKLIKRSLDYLKSRCKVIGLEVRPEIGNNIGLYHKLGFHSSFPFLILEVPEKFPTQPEIFEGNNVARKDGINNYDLEIYSEISEDGKKLFLDKIELWTRQDLKGLSFKKDLELINASNGDIIIVKHEGELLGFLAYYSVVFLHLWGAIKPIDRPEDVLMGSINLFRKINPQRGVLLEVNTRYHDMVDILLNEGFKIIKSVNRMLLTGFEGDYLKKSSDFVMRAWHA